MKASNIIANLYYSCKKVNDIIMFIPAKNIINDGSKFPENTTIKLFKQYNNETVGAYLSFVRNKRMIPNLFFD